MLNVSNLNVHYGMHEALRSVSLSVAGDEIVVILGANGAGKSTLLSAIAGNCAGAVDGQITLAGEPLHHLDTAQIVEQGIAFVPEGRGVFSDLSVEENLQLGSYAEHARHKSQVNLHDVLSLFPKLEERKKQIVRTMSGGEQQMVAIGRALMSAPSILMLDEPSLGLSPLLCKELFSSLMQVRDSGVGVLLVEQNAKQSLNIADRGYLLGNGKIIGEDSAANLLKDPNVQAAYLGGAIASQSTPIAAESVVQSNDTSTDVLLSNSAGTSITPTVSQQSAQTLSADALLNENIDSLVARASSTASKHRTAVVNTPTQVVKLTSRESATANSVSSGSASSTKMAGGATPDDAISTDDATRVKPHVRNTNTATSPADPIDLPQTQDNRVQALLAEFETAAKNAVSGKKSSEQHAYATSANNYPSSANNPGVESEPLPHIPVYKKSSVTVYRRDGAGNLRKQEES